MMSIIQEFKKFAMRGNVVDLAVGVVIGGAFGKITTSLVNDVLTPPLGLLIGGINFSGLKWIIGGPEEKPVAINYGMFLQTIIDFMIIAFAIFLVVKFMNTLREKSDALKAPATPAPPPPPPPLTKDQELLSEIRDLLRNS